ncbi:PA2778 family cysteine peptidase [Pseudoduganella sp. UC29_106]|uniref:PA2778 family cysteine peptidase n=1 Tax=Pseudoduganella sp. UC29_106 TaxID=3374553 RepID=UPI003756461A
MTQRLLAALAALLLLAGCATQTRSLLAAPRSGPHQQELSATPFHAQERYQCGPAALAMLLGAAAVDTSPEALVPEVYLPGREGSLQLELLAAARHHGALAAPISPRLDALLAEIDAGHPVLVLQNLSLPIVPKWHYAVVIGYDLDRGEVILRSGTTRRMTMPLSTFEHTWSRSGYWGMVALAPGHIPATTELKTLLPALIAYEKAAPPQSVQLTYRAALQRWPDTLALQLGVGNSAYAGGDRTAAADAFRRAAASHPDSGAAFNNLAVVLGELGQLAEARAAAQTAIGLGGPWRDEAQATLRTLQGAAVSH